MANFGCVRESGKGLSLLQKAVHPYAQVLYFIELFIDGFVKQLKPPLFGFLTDNSV